MEIGLQMSDNLDLNLDEDCSSLSFALVNSSQFSNSSKDGVNRGGVLKIGTEFESDEHAYISYNKYAKTVGFSVRKDWVNRSKVHGLVVSRKFTCSKEGYRRKDKRDLNMKKHRKETRTGCLAHMIVTRQPYGKYRVTHFEAEHNHDNIDPNNSKSQLLWREIHVDQAAEGDLPSNSGTESSSTFELMNRQFEGWQSLDYLAMDFDNSLQSERIRDMKEGEMYQNALKHLSLVVKDIESFSNDFRSCIYDYNNEEAFVHGSHVAEDLSNNLRSYLNSDQDALQIYKIFERVVDEQRLKEIHANDEMTRCMPRLLGNVVLLKHASGIYTPKAFELFQKEYEKCLNVLVTQCNGKGVLLEYKVSTFGQAQEYTVTFNSADDTVVCNCMKFENVGFLCGHALKVLDNWNIKVVPSRYILKRWTKDTRLGRVRNSSEFTAKENSKLVVASRYENLCRNILKISARAAESEDAFQFALRRLDELIEGVEKILMLKDEEGQGINSSSTVLNAFESENAEYFFDEKELEDLGEDNGVDGTKEKENAAPERHQLKNINGKSCPTHNPLLKGLYNFEANQHVSPTQTPLLHEPLIRSAYHESLTDNALLRQAMDLDLQRPHSSSISLYDHGFRTSDTSYLGLY
ncbi:PROTEIN FAR1-RELATED SEQUENCE 12-LIKE [Salix koriyanagi]|uniref:Protein FAR1-RELATED SEQUENCE n=1 Tax=Salix koriyanagi TaxID=2511006 RepID=A0A9Q0WEZ9_9ROSI|nr:PROTEIN FAR1-RELATED SEQUENCE 12-LIKE [Salix koriyanagi]